MEETLPQYYHYGKYVGVQLAIKTLEIFCFIAMVAAGFLTHLSLGDVLISVPIIILMMVYTFFISLFPVMWIGFISGWFIESCVRLMTPYLSEWRAVQFSMSICGGAALLIFWPIAIHIGQDYSLFILLIVPVLYVVASGIGGYRLIHDLQEQVELGHLPPISALSLLAPGLLFVGTTGTLAYFIWQNI